MKKWLGVHLSVRAVVAMFMNQFSYFSHFLEMSVGTPLWEWLHHYRDLSNHQQVPIFMPFLFHGLAKQQLSTHSHPYSVHLSNARLKSLYMYLFVTFIGKLEPVFLTLFIHLPVIWTLENSVLRQLRNVISCTYIWSPVIYCSLVSGIQHFTILYPAQDHCFFHVGKRIGLIE